MTFSFHFSGLCPESGQKLQSRQGSGHPDGMINETPQSGASPFWVHTPTPQPCSFFLNHNLQLGLISAPSPAPSLQFCHFWVTSLNLIDHVFSALDLDLLSPALIFFFLIIFPSPHNISMAQTHIYIHDFSHCGHSHTSLENLLFIQRITVRGKLRLQAS